MALYKSTSFPFKLKLMYFLSTVWPEREQFPDVDRTSNCWDSDVTMEQYRRSSCIAVLWTTGPVIGVTSYGAYWGTCPWNLHIHQFGNFCLRMTPLGSGRLVVNTTHFSVPATDSRSLKLGRNLCAFCLISWTHTPCHFWRKILAMPLASQPLPLKKLSGTAPNCIRNVVYRRRMSRRWAGWRRRRSWWICRRRLPVWSTSWCLLCLLWWRSRPVGTPRGAASSQPPSRSWGRRE